MITARFKGPDRENKGQSQAINKFLYSAVNTQAIRMGQWENKEQDWCLGGIQTKETRKLG